MTRRVLAAAALAVAAVLALTGVPALGLALRIAFVGAGAAPIGAVLLLAIARTTGADWRSAAPASRWAMWVAPLGAVAMLGATGVALPAHLHFWSHPLFAAARAGVAVGALAWAGHRLRGGAGATFAGLTLALYALFVTPVAADWLLPTAPGHPVSAVGMMLFLLQFAAACALASLDAAGRERRDLLLLLVAALVGLCYLGFVDYLIIWFGNLPARVPFYLERSGWPALAALLGTGAVVAAIVAGRPAVASAAALATLGVALIWWMGGGALAALLALALAMLAACAFLSRRVPRHG